MHSLYGSLYGFWGISVSTIHFTTGIFSPKHPKQIFQFVFFFTSPAMKTYTLLKINLILLVWMVVLSSCKKDDTVKIETGNLTISFYNIPADLTVSVYAMDDAQHSIYSHIKASSLGIINKELNAGNYFIRCYSATFFPEMGFQIKSGKTTTIRYDANNNGTQQ
jgi:hypothetical protein